MKRGCWIALVVGILVVLVIVAPVILVTSVTYNRMVTLGQGVEAAWGQVDVVLQRRNDLIPNLVATIKGYAAHEREIFEHVADARAKLAGARTTEEKVTAANELGSWLSRLLMIVENYPQLRASENFMRLQDELAGTENRIAVERRRYNEAVQTYNTTAKGFFTRIFVLIFGFDREKTYFKAAEGAEEPPRVEF